MKDEAPDRFDSLSDAFRSFGLPKPLHPLISIVDARNTAVNMQRLTRPHVLNFYKISYRAKLSGKLRYGQGYFDFDEGGLLFASPNQVIAGTEDNGALCGITLIIHPDFFLGHPLARSIKQYGFFSYDANEALHLSEAETNTILSIFGMIGEELKSRIDDFSQSVILAQIELLLSYSSRFYNRQFITRKAVSHGLLQQLEELLDDYFNSDKSALKGLPSVQYVADRLSLSASYLSDMLRSLTGQNAQQHIHFRIIEKAKEKLSTTGLSVSEIAYELGFEHPQSFSKMFKTKTSQSPLEFRRSFN